MRNIREKLKYIRNMSENNDGDYWLCSSSESLEAVTDSMSQQECVKNIYEKNERNITRIYAIYFNLL